MNLQINKKYHIQNKTKDYNQLTEYLLIDIVKTDDITEYIFKRRQMTIHITNLNNYEFEEI
jgi:tRNA(His) 5'-end guanylyltransferase